MINAYAIEQASLDHLDPVLAMWQQQLGDQGRVGAQFAWFKHQDSPGDPLVMLLRHVPSGKLVGTSTAAPRRMLWQGRELSAGILFDLAVVAEHRSLGPALMLANSMVQASTEHFDVLYSFPTSQAVAVGRRAGHVHLAELVRYARVLRHARFLSERSPRLVAQLLGALLDRSAQIKRKLRAWINAPKMLTTWSDNADPRFDLLWHRSDHGAGLLRIHDTRMARWRFDAAPFTRTRYLLLSAWDSEELLGWFACHAQGSVLYVDDAWTLDGARGASAACVRQLLLAAWSGGHEAVSFSFAGHKDALQGWAANGFVKRNQRPILGCWTGVREGGPQDVFLTAADEDQ